MTVKNCQRLLRQSCCVRSKALPRARRPFQSQQRHPGGSQQPNGWSSRNDGDKWLGIASTIVARSIVHSEQDAPPARLAFQSQQRHPGGSRDPLKLRIKEPTPDLVEGATRNSAPSAASQRRQGRRSDPTLKGMTSASRCCEAPPASAGMTAEEERAQRALPIGCLRPRTALSRARRSCRPGAACGRRAWCRCAAVRLRRRGCSLPRSGRRPGVPCAPSRA